MVGESCDSFIRALDELMLMVATDNSGSGTNNNNHCSNNKNGNPKVHVSKMSGSMDRVIAPTTSSQQPHQPRQRRSQQQQQQHPSDGFKSVFNGGDDDDDDRHIRDGELTTATQRLRCRMRAGRSPVRRLWTLQSSSTPPRPQRQYSVRVVN